MTGAPPLAGRTLGRFRVLEEIGSGGMGVVYAARDERLERDVALKVLSPDVVEDLRQRFHREARALSRLNHPAIVTFHDLHHEEGLDFLVMERVEGEALDRRIARGALPERQVLEIGIQLADGLAAAHRSGVIHRDLKPANLMVTPEGRLKILDFGLAKLATGAGEAPLTVADTVPGTLPYLAPELLAGGAPDEKSDLYAAGLVLYEAATGSRPFPGLRGPALWEAIRGGSSPQPPLERNPGLSRGVSDLILRCLDAKPENRPESAAALAGEMLALAARPAGGHRRGFPGGRVAAALGLATATAVAAYAVWTTVRPGPAPLTSLAVLPLAGHDSGDPELIYHADGTAQELVGQLSRVLPIRVISWESSRRWDPERVPVKRIARELGAQGLVTGGIEVLGDHVRIRIHLVDGPRDRVMMSRGFEGSRDEVLALQSRAVREIVREIAVGLTPAGRERLASSGQVTPEAYDLYSRGRYHWDRRPADLMRAVSYFERAIAADSLYAAAHAGLADAWAAVGLYALRPPLETRARARAAAERAVELDGNLSEAHAALAHVFHNYDWDWRRAEEEYRRAIDLNPNNGAAHHHYANLLAQLGRFDEARTQIGMALDVAPQSVPSTIAAATFEYFARRWEDSMEHLRRAAELDSGNALAHQLTAAVLDRQGREREAIREIVRALEIQGQPALAAAVMAAERSSGFRGALEVLIATRIRKRESGAYEPAEHVAELFARLGRVDEAIGWLETAYREHDTELNRLLVDPLFDPLRGDPRFADLMRRVGFSTPRS